MLCKIGTARGVNPTSASESAMDDAVTTLTHQKGKGTREKGKAQIRCPVPIVAADKHPNDRLHWLYLRSSAKVREPRAYQKPCRLRETKVPTLVPIEMEAPWKPPSAESGGQGRVEIPRVSVVVTLGWGSGRSPSSIKHHRYLSRRVEAVLCLYYFFSRRRMSIASSTHVPIDWTCKLLRRAADVGLDSACVMLTLGCRTAPSRRRDGWLQR